MKRNSNGRSGGGMLTFISVALILVFVIVCGMAAFPHLKGQIDKKLTQEAELAEDTAVANGEMEPTVSYMARTAGMSVEDYLAQYGLEVNDEVTKDTTYNDLGNYMTLSNYVKFVTGGSTNEDGSEITVDQFLESYQLKLGDNITEDTVYKDLMAMPAQTAYDEETLNGIKGTYGLGDEITSETTVEEFLNAASEAELAQQQSAATDNAETTETPAE